MCRVFRRIQGIESDVTRAARHSDQKRRLDRAIEKMRDTLVRNIFAVRKLLVVARPRAELTAIQFAPAFRLETRIREFAKSERAGTRAEAEMTCRLAQI